METTLRFWIWFHAAVLALVALDLRVPRGGREGRGISMREAALRSAIWVALAAGFACWVWVHRGAGKGVEFITGYVIEYSLSMDNLLLFMVIFAYFKVKRRHQHRVLLWGIIGALVMRAAMIAAGVQLIRSFSWVLYLFGLFLLATGLRMLWKKEDAPGAETAVARFCRKCPRVTPELRGGRFLVREAGLWMLTPLALALLAVDVMDLVFAVDSIPAVFAVTTDPFIVYTSNVCAILGLRSLYFLLAGAAGRIQYLHYGLAAVLVFIGAKMLLGHILPIPSWASLLVVAALLGLAVAASFLFPSTRPASPPVT